MADEPPLKRQKSLPVAFVPKTEWIRLHRRYHNWSVSMCIIGWNARQKLEVDNIECAVWYGEWTREQRTDEYVQALDDKVRRRASAISVEFAELAELGRNVEIDSPIVEEID